VLSLPVRRPEDRAGVPGRHHRRMRTVRVSARRSRPGEYRFRDLAVGCEGAVRVGRREERRRESRAPPVRQRGKADARLRAVLRRPPAVGGDPRRGRGAERARSRDRSLEAGYFPAQAKTAARPDRGLPQGGSHRVSRPDVHALGSARDRRRPLPRVDQRAERWPLGLRRLPTAVARSDRQRVARRASGPQAGRRVLLRVGRRERSAASAALRGRRVRRHPDHEDVRPLRRSPRSRAARSSPRRAGRPQCVGPNYCPPESPAHS